MPRERNAQAKNKWINDIIAKGAALGESSFSELKEKRKLKDNPQEVISDSPKKISEDDIKALVRKDFERIDRLDAERKKAKEIQDNQDNVIKTQRLKQSRHKTAPSSANR